MPKLETITTYDLAIELNDRISAGLRAAIPDKDTLKAVGALSMTLENIDREHPLFLALITDACASMQAQAATILATDDPHQMRALANTIEHNCAHVYDIGGSLQGKLRAAAFNRK